VKYPISMASPQCCFASGDASCAHAATEQQALCQH
jgi:hypothetical protein